MSSKINYSPDVAWMIKFPMGRVLFRAGHTIGSLRNEFQTSTKRCREIVENPTTVPLIQLIKLARLVEQPLQTIINIATGLTPDDKHYLDEEMTSIIEDEKLRRMQWEQSYEIQIKKLKDEKTSRLMPSWAMEDEVTDGRDGKLTSPRINNKPITTTEHASVIEKSFEKTQEGIELIEKRRNFAKNNPKSRSLIKFSYFCTNCRAPEYFGIDNCFTCKFFENDMSLIDKRKVKPPSAKFTYEKRK